MAPIGARGGQVRVVSAGNGGHGRERGRRWSRRRRCTTKCLAVRSGKHEVLAPATQSGQKLNLEVLNLPAWDERGKERNSLVFLHGSYHAAWCFAENFMPYFAKEFEPNRDSYALSFLGQGESTVPEGVRVAGTIETHAEDVASFLASLDRPAVVVAHSFGGLIAQKLVSACSQRKCGGNVAGLCLLCSVPPSGNGAMVGRFLRRTPLAAIKLSYRFATASFTTDAEACRECFFGDSLPQSKLLAYQSKIATSSKIPLIDVRAVSREVPVALGEGSTFNAPVMVVGGGQDKCVDEEGVRETAKAFGTEAVTFGDMAHDVMLDEGWDRVARELGNWITAHNL